MTNQDDLTEQYAYPLRDYLKGAGETALVSAYEFGRSSVAKGISPLDLATIHQKALRPAIQCAPTSEEAARIMERAKEFFAECLSPFEMILRGYLEINATLRQMNESLERRIGERTLELETQRAKMEYQATHDGLTGLPNRILLHDRLQQAILAARRMTKPLAVLMMDLDGFKRINDTMGHHYGDLLLEQIGPRLKTVMRESDTIARLGGDEFLVLLPLADLKDTTQLARKILGVLEKPFVLEKMSFRIGASIGIAIFPTHGTDAETLIGRADEAMYAAKQSGSGYTAYASEKPHASGRLGLMEDLSRAINCEELVLHYQPKVDLRTRRVIGMEALVHWQHPQHGLVPPAQFIPLIERTGLIRPLTDWILQTALRQCNDWHRAGTDFCVAVNLSTGNLHDTQLPDRIERLLHGVGLEGSFLELEIAETGTIEDTERVLDLITRLSGIGVRISTDGFGTGCSSIAYLKKLYANELKIDKSFVSDMTIDERDAMIVQYMVGLAHNLNLKVVAQGVENQETWDRLVALGCDAAQGFFICRPLPADKVNRWLTKHPGGIFVLPGGRAPDGAYD